MDASIKLDAFGAEPFILSPQLVDFARHRPSLFIGEFEKNIGVTRLVERTPASEVLAAERSKLYRLPERHRRMPRVSIRRHYRGIPIISITCHTKTAEFVIGTAVSSLPRAVQSVRVAICRRPPDIDSAFPVLWRKRHEGRSAVSRDRPAAARP